jgi:hypothetical protein
MKHRSADIDALGRAPKRQSALGLGDIQRNLVGALFVIFGPTLGIGIAAATPVGTVIEVSGSCIDHGRVLKFGDVVQIGDTLDVPPGGKLKLQMADGSAISVAPDSNITVASYNINGSSRSVKLSLAQGVLRITSATRPFEVSTAVGIAAASSASADWFVESKAGSARVAVLAGIVDLTGNLIGQSVSIPAHWGARLEAGRAPVPPRVWNQMEFNAFIRITQ